MTSVDVLHQSPKEDRTLISTIFSNIVLDAVSPKPNEKRQYSSLGLIVIPSFKKSVWKSLKKKNFVIC